jgi:phosphoserine aminotransferase
MRLYNFGPGPAALPLEVLEELKENLLSYNQTGIGAAELSHRSKEFEAILNDTKSRLAALLSIPTTHEIIFCSGGATQQFSMVALNLLTPQTVGCYIVSGIWGEKAEKEARKFGATAIVAPSAPLPENAAYLHFTSNDTVEGRQFPAEPPSGSVPLIADASSDILSKPIDISKYALLYAGAQKNLGIAGVTVVIVKKEMLTKVPENLPILLDYRTYTKSNSLYNTPPTLAIYTTNLVLKWLESGGGLKAIAEQNTKKAALLYQTIESFPCYIPYAEKSLRSKMNVTFRLASPELEASFIENAKKHGITGIKGHSTFGGIRASIYNAVTLESVKYLCEFMEEFARQLT